MSISGPSNFALKARVEFAQSCYTKRNAEFAIGVPLSFLGTAGRLPKKLAPFAQPALFHLKSAGHTWNETPALKLGSWMVAPVEGSIMVARYAVAGDDPDAAQCFPLMPHLRESCFEQRSIFFKKDDWAQHAPSLFAQAVDAINAPNYYDPDFRSNIQFHTEMHALEQEKSVSVPSGANTGYIHIPDFSETARNIISRLAAMTHKQRSMASFGVGIKPRYQTFTVQYSYNAAVSLSDAEVSVECEKNTQPNFRNVVFQTADLQRLEILTAQRPEQALATLLTEARNAFASGRSAQFINDLTFYPGLSAIFAKHINSAHSAISEQAYHTITDLIKHLGHCAESVRISDRLYCVEAWERCNWLNCLSSGKSSVAAA